MSREGADRLLWALRQRGEPVAGIEVVDARGTTEPSYELVISSRASAGWGHSEERVMCPYAASTEWEPVPIRLRTCSSEDRGPSVIPIPVAFVRGSGATGGVAELFSRTGPNSSIVSACDLLGLLEWSVGSAPTNEGLARWPEYARIENIGALSTQPYVDQVLEALIHCLGHEGSDSRDPLLLITGDTDASSEGEIVRYLRMVEDAGGCATLLLWSESQLSEKVTRILGEQHSIGIHPYALDGSFEQYAARCVALAGHIEKSLGGPPIACRNHKFQWQEPSRARHLLADLGVRIDLNLVAADGKSWLGVPTGVAQASAVFSTDSGMHFWEMPTVLEDEVFLYDLDYCFLRSGDLRSKYPFSFMTDFLDYWVLQMGRPACVNLHPEHVGDDYGKVLSTILSWAQANHVRMPSIATYLAELEDRVSLR